MGPTRGGEPLRSTAAAAGGVVISQVYGGGGNSGATYKNDFIELFNAGASEVSLAGWSVQYASAAGTSWQVTPLSGTIAPGGYYLVQQAAGTGGTTALPSPNATGTIPMGGTASKIALVNNTTALSGACPLAGAVDFVGIGATANCFEGSGATPASSNTLAVLRKNDGCTDTNVNSADFAALAPTPRNSLAPSKTCDVMPPQPVASVAVAPASPGITVGTIVALTATANDASGGTVSGTTFTWTTSDAAVATVNAAGAVTGVAVGSATITATAPNGVAGSATVTVTASGAPVDVRISEFHYDNDGPADVGEAIEIEGGASGSLAGWSLVLYSGSTGSSTQGQSYATVALSGTLGSSCGGTRGVLVFSAPGLQNGDKDGIALVNAGGQVVEFISYEGSFAATTGPAAGMTSTDVGVAESGSTPAGRSLQRALNGAWFGPTAATFGACNPATPPVPQFGVTISGRVPTEEPLPVGFQDQLFPTLRNESGTAVPTTFTWTSETPQVATVDARGVITALSAGTATFRATAADGTTGSISLPMEVAAAGDASLYKNPLALGTPTDATPDNDLRVSRPQYELSYDRGRNIPNWVAYHLSRSSRGDMPGYRCDCFTTDPKVTEAGEVGISTADYTGSGFDRGHMVRSNDRELARYDQATTYYMSNIVPQYANNNQGRWGDLETHLQAVTEGAGAPEVYIFAGARGEAGRIGNGRIAVPTHVWKVAFILPAGMTPASVDEPSDIIEVIAVDMPNVANLPRDGNWRAHATTVDAIEAVTGYDLLSALPNRLEQVLESGTRAPVARTDGPYIALEGSEVHLNASASTDPDGDALTFEWEFGDGAKGTGATPTHTYADNGTYLVKLTVTDVHGAESSVTTSVVVANADPVVHVFAGASLLAGESYTGSTSFVDAGADQWTATVDYGDGSGAQPLAISGRNVELSHRYTQAGSYTVTVTVRDNDGGVGTQKATVTVQSASQGIAGLQTLVATLGRTGSLNRGNVVALDAKLRAADASLARGDETPAVNQLEAFVHQVGALAGTDGLSQAEADGMTAAAARIIRSIQQ